MQSFITVGQKQSLLEHFSHTVLIKLELHPGNFYLCVFLWCNLEERASYLYHSSNMSENIMRLLDLWKKWKLQPQFAWIGYNLWASAPSCMSSSCAMQTFTHICMTAKTDPHATHLSCKFQHSHTQMHQHPHTCSISAVNHVKIHWSKIMWPSSSPSEKK